MAKSAEEIKELVAAEGELPHFFIGHRVYYRTSDVRAFVKKHCDYWQIKAFENGTKAKED
ncbi:hypothetical protein EZS27_042033 [termite gut metagenome]|uniref:Helix-turn-helix domain-containing protein n=1 Tax=termite gut metagenome TaxID=433724 RepID=A0A5J4PCB3_9ZZZZ